MNENKIFSRQLDLVKPSELDFPIWVIGAGGIGSWTTLALAKMGCPNLTVIDFDLVEEHNVPSQIYTPDQVKQPKVLALKDLVKQLTGTEIIPVQQKFQDWYQHENAPAVIICAVDSLETRKEIWQLITTNFPIKFDLFIDCRMGGELLRILTASPLNVYTLNQYAQSLNSETPVSQEPCTGRSIVYNTFVCGGIVASLIKKYAKKEVVQGSIVVDLIATQIF